MSLLQKFKEFAIRGNVIDLAVGIIIGAAFGKIVASVVNDIIMPPLGAVIGGVDFKDLKLPIKHAELDASGAVVKEAVTLNYGNFLQTTFEFLIVAFAVFLLVQAITRLQAKEEAKPAEPVPPSNEEKLLTEIRDLLKK